MVKNRRSMFLLTFLLAAALSCAEKPQEEIPADRETPNVVDMQGNPALHAQLDGLGGQINLKVDDKEPAKGLCARSCHPDR